MDNPKVFFSYSRADSDFVLQLATDLRSAGVDLWIDQLDIAAGERWDRAIEDALGAAPCLLVVLSPASVASNNVMDEVSLAFDERKKIVPVLARECTIPFRLRRLQHIDFTTNFDRGLESVLKALNAPRRPEVEPDRDGSRKAAFVAAPKAELAGSGPARFATGTTIDPRPTEWSARGSSARASGRAYGALAMGALGLAATAGSVAVVLASRSLPPAKDHVSAQGAAPSQVDAATRRETVPPAALPPAEARDLLPKFPPGPDGDRPPFFPPPPPGAGPPPMPPPPRDFGPRAYFSDGQAGTALQVSTSPLRDTGSRPRLATPHSSSEPINGVWDVTLSCGGGAELKEYGARFTDGVHLRAFEDVTGSRNTRLVLEYVGTDAIKLSGSVAVGATAVSAIDATGQRRGISYVGLGILGHSTNCWLTITDRS